MATLTVQSITRSGLNPSYASADASDDEFSNSDGRAYAEVVNDGGAPITVTVVTPQVVNGLPVGDLTVNVPNGERRKIGPFPQSTFNDSSDNVTLQYSAVTSVTVGVFKVS